MLTDMLTWGDVERFAKQECGLTRYMPDVAASPNLPVWDGSTKKVMIWIDPGPFGDCCLRVDALVRTGERAGAFRKPMGLAMFGSLTSTADGPGALEALESLTRFIYNVP